MSAFDRHAYDSLAFDTDATKAGGVSYFNYRFKGNVDSLYNRPLGRNRITVVPRIFDITTSPEDYKRKMMK